MKLHPFFSYFGSKYRIAKLYDMPIYNTIIEPFAGSAGYSLFYPEKSVVLYDSYEPIIALWKYLIKVSEKEILGLPVKDFDKEESNKNRISDLAIAEEAKTLIGFWTTESQTYSSDYPLSKSRGGNWTEKKRAMIAEQLQYIRHWKAEVKNYYDADLQMATWFVDPPYEKAGKRYKKTVSDYSSLAAWCRSLPGQVIVCEQNPAKWLNFSSLVHINNASNKKYQEVVWTNNTKEIASMRVYCERNDPHPEHDACPGRIRNAKGSGKSIQKQSVDTSVKTNLFSVGVLQHRLDQLVSGFIDQSPEAAEIKEAIRVLTAKG